MSTEYVIPVTASYHQVQVVDEQNPARFDDCWTNEALANHVIAVDNGFAISTDTDGPVVVKVQFTSLDAVYTWLSPILQLVITSSQLCVVGPMDLLNAATHITVEPGLYTVQVAKEQLTDVEEYVVSLLRSSDVPKAKTR